MLTVSEAIVRSALERQESRGSQWRFDFPEKDDQLGRVNLVVGKGEGGMAVQPRELELMPDPVVQRLVRSRFFDRTALPRHYAGKVTPSGDEAR